MAPPPKGELEQLCLVNGMENAYVRDAWGNRWCSGRPFSRYAGAEIDAAVNAAVSACAPSLPRGGKLDTVIELSGRRALVVSFAGVYLLVVEYRTPAETFVASVQRQAMVRKATLGALPKIERLTLALPPPAGPGSGSAEGVGTA